MRRALRFAVASLAIFSSSVSGAESMKDFWTQRSPLVSYASNKSALALEYCLGLNASEYGTTTTLHGEGVTLVSIVNPGQIISTVMGFRISEANGHRAVEVFARGSALGNWVKWSRRTAENCV